MLFLFILEITLPVTIIPGSIRVREWTPFHFVCNSQTGQVTAYFKADGSPVEQDSRFHVNRYNSTAIEITAPLGLRNFDDMEIE